MVNEENKKPESSVSAEIPKVKEAMLPETSEAMEESVSVSRTVQALLKSPYSLGARIRDGGFGTLLRNLICVAIVCCLGYGVIMGSFSGGAQWYASPVKALMGLFLTTLFCLPSLYIFTCMSGADIRLGQVIVILVAVDTLTTILLIGLGPIAWVFSQSTNSVFFMGFLHILFWLVSFGFAMKLLLELTRHMKPKNVAYVRIWMIIFLLTSFQMMTALRPLVGTSKNLFPKEKKFFLKHWIDTSGENGDRNTQKQPRTKPAD
jgi:hypothetical protein